MNPNQKPDMQFQSEVQEKQRFYKVFNFIYDNCYKFVFLISSITLAISFGFIEDLIHLESAKSKDYLIYAWCFQGIAFFLSLLNIFISGLHRRLIIKNRRKKIERGMQWWNIIIRSLNVFMSICLLVGIYFLINFIKRNTF